MNFTLEFDGRTDERGRVHMDDKAAFDRHTATMPNKRVTVIVKEARSQRSIEQNKWLWGVALPLIAEEIGYDRHELELLHYELLSVRFGTVTVEPRVPGALPVSMPVQTTKSMKVDEFSDYMEWLCRFAAEKFGVVVPLPSERLTEREKVSA